MRDRKFRAIVLVMSESGHRMSNTIAEQRDIIADNTYLLEIRSDSEESYQVSIYRNIRGVRREAYSLGSISNDDFLLSPKSTNKPFIKHKLFSDLIENMPVSHVPHRTYCIEFKHGDDVTTYFRYDGMCFATVYDVTGVQLMSITLDPVTAFHVLKETYEKIHFHIMPGNISDFMFDY
jgi:hypothetical protein